MTHHSDDRFEIKIADREAIDLAVQWAAEEGWNPGLEDADSFYQTDSQGFLVAYLDEQPIATISVVKYGEAFAFLGFYIVKPEYRGQGYGIQIWQAGLKHCQGRNIGLDGVVEQQDNYKKSGFQLAYRNIRYAGTSRSMQNSYANIQPINNYPLAEVIAYDSAFFPVTREAFLTAWLSQPRAISLGWSNNGKLSGYGMIRPCHSGYKIGPLFADNSTIAEQLFESLVTSVEPNQPIFLDIPEVNPHALALVEKHGMEKVFETARMYNQTIPNIDTARCFGVTSFELG